jgi:hypothetical protein
MKQIPAITILKMTASALAFGQCTDAEKMLSKRLIWRGKQPDSAATGLIWKALLPMILSLCPRDE